MHVTFCCDSDEKIGGGHVFRCLNVARALKMLVRSKGVNIDISFYSESLLEESSQQIHAEGFKLRYPSLKSSKLNMRNYPFKEDGVTTDLIFIDKYEFGDFELEIERASFKKIIIIDDIGKHKTKKCWLYVNPAIWASSEECNHSAPSLTGKQYAIVSERLVKAKNSDLTKNSIFDVLVCLGMSDQTTIIKMIINSLELYRSRQLKVNLISPFIKSQGTSIGAENFFHEYKLTEYNANMSNLYNGSEICFVACGGMALECLYLEKKAAFFCVAENQIRTMEMIQSSGFPTVDCFTNLPNEAPVQLRVDNLVETTLACRYDKNFLNKPLLDGLGAQRIASFVWSLLGKENKEA